RCAVSRVSIGFVGRAVSDDALEDDNRRLVGDLFGRVDGPLNRAEVIGVVYSQSVPAVTFETRGDVLAKGQLGVAFDRDGVVVVDPEQVVEFQVAGDGGGFTGNTLHEVTVAAEHIDAVLE